MENEFDDLQGFEEVQEEVNDMVEPPKQNTEQDFEFGEISSGENKYQVVLNDEDINKEFVIESAEIMKPVTRDVDGNFIEPKAFNDKQPDKKGYVSKVRITYKGTNYLSVIPNVKWYIARGDKPGTKKLNPWFLTKVTSEKLDDNFTSEIGKMHYKFCKAYGYQVELTDDEKKDATLVEKNSKKPELSGGQFIKELVGKKVKLSQWKTFYEGGKRFRIDIKEFL
jgi:hypothetical protein